MPETLRAVSDLGFTELTPIQAKILPHTLASQDAIGQAQTGTGKTATFLLTIMEALLKRPFGKSEERYSAPRASSMCPKMYNNVHSPTEHPLEAILRTPRSHRLGANNIKMSLLIQSIKRPKFYCVLTFKAFLSTFELKLFRKSLYKAI